MLELINVHTHYGLSHILQGVSLSIAQGEVLGVFGRNGVGKSTLVKTIARWVDLTSGSMRFGSTDIAALPPESVCHVIRALEVCDRFCAIERGSVVLQGNARSETDRLRLFEAIAV